MSDLRAATLSSAAADLSSAQNYTLSPGGGVYKLSMGVFGPIPPKTVGLIVGRSSSIMKGLFVHVGVIDEDYNREIKIMASVPQTLHALPGDCIAQLLLLPYVTFPKIEQSRSGGFGSTGKKIF